MTALRTRLAAGVLLIVACSGGTPSPAEPAQPEPTQTPPASSAAPTTAVANSTPPSAAVAAPVGAATTSGDLSGNRIVWGSVDLGQAPLVVALDRPAAWIVGILDGASPTWVVVADDGTIEAYRMENDSAIRAPIGGPLTLPPGVPPLVVADAAGPQVVDLADAGPGLDPSPLTAPGRVGDEVIFMGTDGRVVAGGVPVEGPPALADGRIVTSSEGRVAYLAEPTGRFGHGVLGDFVESESIVVTDLAPPGSVDAILDAPDDTVFEAISPMWADVDGDGVEEIVATASDGMSGARLVVYAAEGGIMAQSVPIGRGNRWLNQLGAGPVGPGGEIEIVEVRTPHIGGEVRWYRLSGGQLVLQTTARTYSTHRIGSRNLDQGLFVDTNGDGRLDVLVPTQDQTALVGLARTGDGVAVTASVELGARLVSNVAAVGYRDGAAALAAGTADGSLYIWP